MERTFIFNKSISLQELSDKGLYYNTIDYKNNIIFIKFNDVEFNDFGFYGYINNNKELTHFVSPFIDSSVLEQFIIKFDVLFIATDDYYSFITEEQLYSMEHLYEESLSEYGLEKYLRYNKIKNIKKEINDNLF